MPKTEEELKQLKDMIYDVVYQSHSSVAKVQSDNFYEIKGKLDIVADHVEQIKEYQKTQNGNVAKAVKDIQENKTDITKIKSSFSGAKWIGAGSATIIIILIGTITSLSLYAYSNDKKILSNEIMSAKETISKHEKVDSESFNQLVKLLKEKK